MDLVHQYIDIQFNKKKIHVPRFKKKKQKRR